MRITTQRPLGCVSALLAVVSLALVLGACSHTTMPGPTWNLTGGKDRALLPPKPIYAEAPRQAALPPPPPTLQPVATYRGGRDPITGRAPSFGGAQPGLRPAPAQPPAMTQPRPMDQKSQVEPVRVARAPADRARTVEVRPGQTLSIIATEQRVSLASLMAANNLRDPYLIPGQMLTIPRH
jgi:LysM domain